MADAPLGQERKAPGGGRKRPKTADAVLKTIPAQIRLYLSLLRSDSVEDQVRGCTSVFLMSQAERDVGKDSVFDFSLTADPEPEVLATAGDLDDSTSMMRANQLDSVLGDGVGESNVIEGDTRVGINIGPYARPTKGRANKGKVRGRATDARDTERDVGRGTVTVR